MTQNKMGEDAGSDFAIPFVDENDYSDDSLFEVLLATRRQKQKLPKRNGER